MTHQGGDSKINASHQNVTILSNVEPIIKDFTFDSNIISTGRDRKTDSMRKDESPEGHKEEENAKTEKMSKQSTLSEVENKRAKFFEKMTGLMKTQTASPDNNLSKTVKPNNNINIPQSRNEMMMSRTLKPTEKKSLNMNHLIKNLENHMTGNKDKNVVKKRRNSPKCRGIC